MIIPYNQSDPRWGNLTIGQTGLKMKDFGCAITSIASLDGRSPGEILKILNDNQCFTYKHPKYPDGMLIWPDAARFLGMWFDGFLPSEEKPGKMCIAETRRWIRMGWGYKYLTHFFVWLNNGNILDPWDGREKLNHFRVYSWRLFYPKEAV